MNHFSARTKLVLVSALAALAGSGAIAATSPRSADLTGQRGTLWIANRGLDNVTAFDGKTGAVLATIPVGKEPNSVFVAPGTEKAYVTDELNSRLSVISTMTRSVLKTIPVGSRPHHIRGSHDGRRIYAAEFGTNKVAVIDTATDTLVAEYVAHPESRARTHMAELTFDGATLYTVNEVVNEIGALEAASGRFLYSIPVGNRPSEILVTRNGRRAFVSVRAGENKIKALDLTTRAITGEVATSQQPDTLQLTPDERWLVVSHRGTPAQIQVIDARSLAVVATVDVAGPGTTAGHNWLSANGRYTFVTFEGGSAPGIAVVDHRAGHRVVAAYAYPGGGRPHGIYYDDPAAREGPEVRLPARARVAGSRVARVVVTCSANAIVFCRGTLSLRGARSGRFSAAAGRRAVVQVRVSKQTFARLLRRGLLGVRATAVATDQLGNSRRTQRVITLQAMQKRAR